MQSAYQMQNQSPQIVQNSETINIVETKMLYLSTKKSQCTQLNGDMKSRVSFDIRTFLDFQNDDTVQAATLSMPYAILCNSNYQINYTNCRLDMQVGGTNYSYNFPYGNYAVDTFMQAFLALVPSTFGISFNQTSGCFTITNSANPFTLLGTSTIDYVVGFSGNLAATFVSPKYTLTCPRLANFLSNPLFRICVESNSIYNGQVLGAAGAPAYSNVLASIPNLSKPNSSVIYQNFSDEFAIQPTGQTTLIISILDDNGNFIDFNGVSSYFQLRVRLYKKIKKLNKTLNEMLTTAVEARKALEEMAAAAAVEMPLDRFFGRPPPIEGGPEPEIISKSKV